MAEWLNGCVNNQQFLHARSERSCEWLTYCIFSESRCQLAEDGVGVFRPDGVQVEGPTSIWHSGQTSYQADQRGWGRESGSCTWGCQTCRFGGSYVLEAPPALALPEHHPADDEVVVKKWALKCVKQQVLALLHGEDLPKGAQAREVTEVPYEVQAVPRGETTCPVCGQIFKMYHHVTVHMGIHRGEKFPCCKCGKVLTTRSTWMEHTKACVQGNWMACPVCGWEYASALVMHQHHHAKHGADAAAPQGGYVCPFCGKVYQIKKTWGEHKPYCLDNPNRKGPY